jgi:hypothetical protein
MKVDDAPPTLGPADAFPDVMADLAVRRRREEVSARLFGTSERLTRIGRYRVGRRLGSGAIGVVHLAHDDLLGRDVAIKLLRTRGDANEAEARRAVREAQALARLSHPNVVAVFATGIDGGHGFIAMELVHGSTLRTWQTDRPSHLLEILDPQRVKDRRVQVVDLDRIGRRSFLAGRIGFPQHDPLAEPSAPHDAREPARPVVAPVERVDPRRAAELADAQHDRALE